ncbi:hypothetical protein SAMN05216349_1525 [Oribacterium sp. KHPX15]|uniref:hypothetical protein n=1 Tax=Oribacterium sp. KHPX15 TaxID=1855342 RepID=UPI00089D4AD9|nr:hypothetical protein [Oribacterium sp. KHPX15]SEA91459.1 hypothetical protein SAMN05216349_1525 [Oribacterium sp. KHPX15]
MENIKFEKYEANENGTVTMYFKIGDQLANYIRKISRRQHKLLDVDLRKDNLFEYKIIYEDGFENLLERLTETIEKISNEGDEVYFCNHLISDNGKKRFPADIHELMHKEYGLIDIDSIDDEDDSLQYDIDLEWWTAHFFIRFRDLLYEEPDTFVTENDVDYQEDTEKIVQLSCSEMSRILEMIKSIDKIIVVDDVRKYDSEDIRKMNEEIEKKESIGESDK